jgi:hypothetical protein
LFDFIQPNGISGRRAETIAATQALYLLNNELPRKRAAALAERLAVDASETAARLELLWLRVHGRPITADERRDADDFLQAAGEPAEAWTELCHSLLGSNEFLHRK